MSVNIVRCGNTIITVSIDYIQPGKPFQRSNVYLPRLEESITTVSIHDIHQGKPFQVHVRMVNFI